MDKMSAQREAKPKGLTFPWNYPVAYKDQFGFVLATRNKLHAAGHVFFFLAVS